jgi:hypothetical protein
MIIGTISGIKFNINIMLYEPTTYYKKMQIEGDKYQIYVAYIFSLSQILNIQLHFIENEKGQRSGETTEGYEIKYDRKFKESKNLYIEFAEKSNANYQNYSTSGIMKMDNSNFYVIGNYSTIFIFNKKNIVKYFENRLYKEVITNTSKGYLLYDENAKYIADKIIEIEENNLKINVRNNLNFKL